MFAAVPAACLGRCREERERERDGGRGEESERRGGGREIAEVIMRVIALIEESGCLLGALKSPPLPLTLSRLIVFVVFWISSAVPMATRLSNTILVYRAYLSAGCHPDTSCSFFSLLLSG